MVKTDTIYCGDCREVMQGWDDECIDCVITSPPYWSLRKYPIEDIEWKDGWKGQLGLEPTFDLYIKHLCDIFDDVKRVLKKEGTVWVNLGDTYNSTPIGRQVDPLRSKGQYEHKKSVSEDISIKSLIMIPFRFAIEMVNRGWVLRNTIIWHKNNPMPSSAKDRFTVDFEYLFFFSKNKNYYFEQQFEDYKESTITRANYGSFSSKTDTGIHGGMTIKKQLKAFEKIKDDESQGRNMRCVWTIPTMPCHEAHFAVFPERLLMTPIKSGCPEFICSECGKARLKIWDTDYIVTGSNRGIKNKERKKGDLTVGHPSYDERMLAQHHFRGYTNCNCNAEFEGGIVLDIFGGRGTTGIVAQKLGRKYILIDQSPEYCKMAEKNLSQKWLF